MGAFDGVIVVGVSDGIVEGDKDGWRDRVIVIKVGFWVGYAVRVSLSISSTYISVFIHDSPMQSTERFTSKPYEYIFVYVF